jgi:hypothetical protein
MYGIFGGGGAEIAGWKKYLLCHSLTSAAKADSESKAFIAAVNRCASQNQNVPLRV